MKKRFLAVALAMAVFGLGGCAVGQTPAQLAYEGLGTYEIAGEMAAVYAESDFATVEAVDAIAEASAETLAAFDLAVAAIKECYARRALAQLEGGDVFDCDSSDQALSIALAGLEEGNAKLRRKLAEEGVRP